MSWPTASDCIENLLDVYKQLQHPDNFKSKLRRIKQEVHSPSVFGSFFIESNK